ncbi:hypothetical protein I302_104779 [Kwoniella bestiolae CBS 10118]|uniref:Uncharacterized protein n=1 Tax=Kwoniella bestiolae CBS 10118 TaxID=1296100 RepID=A0A1B9FRR5_9TREE|nr:hypothetical protein I302_09152 [Kwoniella bestiolae CBS 10118]OCF21473.1 hypothetical protein I302_09152 [Kwoniella bestiolae CBS 10118]
MKSLLRTLSNRSNSTQPEPTPSSPATPPVIPPITTGISIYHDTPSIPIPTTRRSSEPVGRTNTNERWARPTLPSYAVSRVLEGNSDLPEYEVAISPSSINNDDGSLNRAATEYFGTSPNDSAIRSTSPIEESALDTTDENVPSFEGEDDDDDPLMPRRRVLDENGQPSRRNTFSVFEPPHPHPTRTGSTNLSTSLGNPNSNGFIDLPIPTSEPPIYSPSLGRDELRLISTVHLSADHPASAYFNAIAQSPPPPAGPSSSNWLRGGEANTNTSTGGKKLKLTLTKGGRRMNANGTGPLYIKLGREGWVDGRIEVGKVDRAVGLEVAIIGMINVSYYVRGQYTVLDTLPLARNKVQLFPKPSEEGTTTSNEQPLPGPNPSVDTSESSQPSSTTNLLPSEPSTEPLLTKDGQPMISPNTLFTFSLQMPNCHFKDENSELPPSCDLQQVGMQANVEYVLRVKLVRKGLRFNETVTVPIIYDPRAYITPRRIRALTSDDPLNPGWRTLELNGGKPKSKNNLPVPSGTEGPGIEVSLLLPSPPILFLPSQGQGDLPTFPFHLHFHSTLPHVLSTFSNPEESKFVVRLTRVTIFRVGLEKEIRRIEIPTKAEVWQEGGERIMLGVENEQRRGSTANGRRESTGTEGLSSSVPTSSNLEGGPLRRFSSAGSTNAPESTGTRRKSLLGDRRGSFSLLKRRGSTSSQTSSGGNGNGNTMLSPTTSNLPLPPIIDEDHPTHEHDEGRPMNLGIAPVDMTSTEVHLKGLISLKPFPISTSSSAAGAGEDSRGIDILRKLMVPSFIVPEITLTYVLEIGIEPRKGSVKENFGHVWGGGIVEVVWGR